MRIWIGGVPFGGHDQAMLMMRVLIAFGLSGAVVLADEIPPVEDAIPAHVVALGDPELRPFKAGVRMLTLTNDPAVQEHVNQGLSHLHGGWDLEAARHFAVAMKLEPNCLVANWGMVMALLTPSPEAVPARDAALERMFALLENDHGSELERGYAYALVKYLENGPLGAASAFARVAKRFPNDMQATIFESIFSRSGFDDLGEPKPDQERAERMLRGLMAEYPSSAVPMNALLTIRSDGGDLGAHYQWAKKLNEMEPDYPPYLHLLGHYAWRCGHHRDAVKAFEKASELYEQWMKSTGASVADCADWVRSDAYRIVAMASLGQFDDAMEAAQGLAKTPVPHGRERSSGARALYWEATTLPARLLLRLQNLQNAEKAQGLLPTVEETKALAEYSLAGWWIDGLRVALEVRRSMVAGNHEDARNVVSALTLLGEKMTETQAVASANGERSSWNRGFRGLEVLASETYGLIAMSGQKDHQGSAFNWFRGAMDRQLPSTLMYPPAILMPLGARLGDFYLMQEKPDRAIEAYEEALRAFPNDMNTLIGLLDAAEAVGDDPKIEEVAARISAIRAGMLE